MFGRIKELFSSSAKNFNWMADAEKAIHLLTDEVEALKLELAAKKSVKADKPAVEEKAETKKKD